MSATVELWMPFDNIYTPALSIPIDACQRFSVHPLTWLRYLAFTIYGNRGYISTSPSGSEVDYHQATTIQPGIYYYVSQDSPFLLDPDLMEDRTSDSYSLTSSVSTSSSQRDFRQRVNDRDGNRCVMTGAVYRQACHIVPHAKGHQYLINLASHRHEQGVDPPLTDINDTRNGILLALQLHGPFCASEIAFLQIPNFAMTFDDVDLVMQPNASSVLTPPSSDSSNRRLTFQHFNNHDPVTAIVAPHNSDARQSDGNEWPPSFMFDAAYGCAALKTWGVQTFKDLVRGRVRNIYYRNSENVGGSSDCGQCMKRPCARAAKRGKAKGIAQEISKSADSEEPDFADMVLALWMHDGRKGQQEACAMRSERARERVQAWLDDTGE